MVLADGFDEALIGVGSRCGQPDVAVYDIEAMIKAIMRDQNVDIGEAWEHFDFNILGAWIGPETPIFVRRATAEQIREEADE